MSPCEGMCGIGSMCVVLCTHKKVVCMRMWVNGYVCICMKEGGVYMCGCAHVQAGMCV